MLSRARVVSKKLLLGGRFAATNVKSPWKQGGVLLPRGSTDQNVAHATGAQANHPFIRPLAQLLSRPPRLRPSVRIIGAFLAPDNDFQKKGAGGGIHNTST